jgi:hypothetical protein
MNFVDWCTDVLEHFLVAYEASGVWKTIGIDVNILVQSWWGNDVLTAPEWHESTRRLSLLDALDELEKAHLLDENSAGFYRPSEIIYGSPSPSGLSDILIEVWTIFAATQLNAQEELVLSAIEKLSHVASDDIPEINRITVDQLEAELGNQLDREARYVTVESLDRKHMVSWTATMGMHFTTFITYRGLVRLLKRSFTIESNAIDELVKEWETTSVEFKRDVLTDTGDHKAELVKDLLSLVNTQASGRRWLIIGFDDRSRRWAQAPNRKLTQNHIEQLVSAYIEPSLDVRYDVIQFRAGPVGRLEVLREPSRLPYRASREITGTRRKVREGQVFVRHGSQVEEPTPLEMAAIEDEGRRARNKDHVR